MECCDPVLLRGHVQHVTLPQVQDWSSEPNSEKILKIGNDISSFDEFIAPTRHCTMFLIKTLV